MQTESPNSRIELGDIRVVLGEDGKPVERLLFFDYPDNPHYEEGKAVRDAYKYWLDMTDKYADDMVYAEVGRDFNNNLCGRVILKHCAGKTEMLEP